VIGDAATAFPGRPGGASRRSLQASRCQGSPS
jgi:hypothetical protein